MMKKVFIIVYFLLLGIVSTAWAQAEYTASGMRDPFEVWLPQEEKAKEAMVIKKEPVKPPAIVVSSIIAGGPIPQAIIKGKIVRIGDSVDGALITNITKEGITILYQYETFDFPSPSKLLKYKQGGNNAK